MKKITNILMLCAGIFIAKAQNSLTINMTNLRNKGNLEIGLFNKKDHFLKEGHQYLKRKVKVSANTTAYTFDNLPKGDYAVAVYQDENSNGKCDTNFIGVPTEVYGFSNNYRPKLSAPKFEQTKIFVEKSKSIYIRLAK